MSAPIPPLRKLGANIPVELDDVIMRGLSRDLETRYLTAKDFAEAIERAAGVSNIGTREDVGRVIEAVFGARMQARHEKIRAAMPGREELNHLLTLSGLSVRGLDGTEPRIADAAILASIAPPAPSGRYSFAPDESPVRLIRRRPPWVVLGSVGVGVAHRGGRRLRGALARGPSRTDTNPRAIDKHTGAFGAEGRRAASLPCDPRNLRRRITRAGARRRRCRLRGPAGRWATSPGDGNGHRWVQSLGLRARARWRRTGGTRRFRDRASKQCTWTVAPFVGSPLDITARDGKERLHQAQMIFRTMALSVAVAVALAAGCDQSDPISAPCRDIPANGCPLLDDDSECTDRCCAAAYSCSDGTWTLEHACPQFQGCDAGTSTPVEDAGSYCDVAGFDAPPGAGGGEGCVR